MRGLLGFVCLLLIGLCVGLTFLVADTETRADRWNERITALHRVEQLNRDLLLAQEYSSGCIEATRMLAIENGLLCEREAKMVQVVSEFETENRSLKNSLSEAVERLEDQVAQINKLMEENGRLNWRVETLEKALDAVSAKDKQELTKEVGNTIIDNLTELCRAANMAITIVPLLF